MEKQELGKLQAEIQGTRQRLEKGRKKTMAKVEVKTPPIITLEFRQEKGDKDYGSCMWARFVIDTENYDMHITSDCGNYGYGWIPTPEAESFLKLLSRMDSEYLLDKIATRETVDTEETYENIKFLLEQCADEELEDVDVDLEEIETACGYKSIRDVADAVRSVIKYTALNEHIEDYELYENISMTYSASQKKIGEVFREHIQPKIKELLKEGEKEC